MFGKITIIGMGLIGSSLARSIRDNKLAKTVVGVDSSKDVCEKLVQLGLVDEVTSSAIDGVKGADFIILATPVGAIDCIAEAIGPFLKEGSIISDAGSVKGTIAASFEKHIPSFVHIVPAHPIAGTENSGPEAGFPELFHNRWCILTPLENTPIAAVEKVSAFWEACGSVIEIMDAKHHDLVLGVTSHLPHLIAYTIVGTATELEDEVTSEVLKFSASGFRDFTRIAASDPEMWRDVFLHNRESVLEILGRFSEDLSAMQKAIRRGDGDFLFDYFSNTRDIRRKIIELGQADYVAPGGKHQEGTPPV